jgi:hypothetical protein
MKVLLNQRGGLAAGIRLSQPPLVVNTATLGAQDADELRQLVLKTVGAGEPAPQSGKARDALTYELTVENEGRATTLTQSDASMTAEFSELLVWLQRHHGR